MAGQSGVRILVGKNFFLLHVSGPKLKVCQIDHMHPTPKLKKSAATYELVCLHGVDRYKFDFHSCTVHLDAIKSFIFIQMMHN